MATSNRLLGCGRLQLPFTSLTSASRGGGVWYEVFIWAFLGLLSNSLWNFYWKFGKFQYLLRLKGCWVWSAICKVLVYGSCFFIFMVPVFLFSIWIFIFMVPFFMFDIQNFICMVSVFVFKVLYFLFQLSFL